LLKRAFEYFDKDGSGDMNISEFNHVLHQLNIFLPDNQVRAIHQSFGPDEEGNIPIRQIVTAIIQPDFVQDQTCISSFLWGVPQRHPRPAIREAKCALSHKEIKQTLKNKVFTKVSGGAGILRRTFNFFDKDKSGAIEVDEFQEVLAAFAIHLTLDEVQAFMDDCMGEDNVEEISYPDFYKSIMDVELGDVSGMSFFTGSAKSNAKQLKTEMIKNNFQDPDELLRLTPRRVHSMLSSKIQAKFGPPGTAEFQRAAAACDISFRGKLNRKETEDLLERNNISADADVLDEFFEGLGPDAKGEITVRNLLLSLCKHKHSFQRRLL